MAYHIASSDSQKIILQRDSSKGASILFVLVGTLFFGIGVSLNFFMDSWEFRDMLFKLLFPFFGLVAIYAGLSLPRQARKTQPLRITFDHSLGAVIIEMEDNQQKGFIRYDETDGFDVYVESRSSSSSSGKSSKTYYYYHVYLKKKDGGQWHLFQYNNRQSAEAMIAQLVGQIPFGNSFKYSEAPKLSSKIEKKDGLDKTIIYWKNKVTWGQAIFLLFFAAIFISILSIIFIDDGGLGMFGFIVGGIMFAIFGLVMFIVARKMIKDATTRYAVSVDSHNLEYYEFSQSSGAMKNRKAIALTEVQSINYTFAPSKNYQNSGLNIYTQENINREQWYKEKPLEAVKDLFNGLDKSITLSITALNPVECLQLENWLQELILKKSNVTVQ